MDKIFKFGAILTLVGLLTIPQEASAYPLTAEQTLRLKSFAPKTYARLEARDTLYVVALGDSVTWGYSPEPELMANGDSLSGYVGVFLDRLAREFFYPGGVRLLNPPNGLPQKVNDHIGREILLENLAIGGRCMVDGMQKMTTEVFVHQPDLVLINYGINDAVRRLPLDEYRRSLQFLIESCKAQRTDVIVMSPNLINEGTGIIKWGLTRPYAQIAKEVAEKNKVLFCDLGQALSRWGGGQDAFIEPVVAMDLVDERLRRIFNWGKKVGSAETLHPNLKAHEYMGLTLFEDLLNKPEASDYTMTGTAEIISEKEVRMNISLRNQSDEDKIGFLGALGLPAKLEPLNSLVEFEIPAGTNKQFDFVFERPSVGKHPDGSDYFGPWSINDAEVRATFVLSDLNRTELIEPKGMRLAPLSIAFRKKTIENVTTATDGLRVEWVFKNGSDKSVNGTYRIGLGDDLKPPRSSSPGSFTLPPLGEKTYFAMFNLPAKPGDARLQRNLYLDLEVDGKRFRFDRELEANKDLVLGEKVALSPMTRYGIGPGGNESASLKGNESGATLRFEADENAFFAVVDLKGIQLQDLGDQPALAAEFFIDARPQNEVRRIGFVDRIRVEAPFLDGPGIVNNIQISAFGNGYNMRLDPRGVQSILKTPDANSRRLEVRIPREYLFRHEWNLGNQESLLGVKANLYLGRIDPKNGQPSYPIDAQYVLTAPQINLDGAKIAGPYARNAATLQTLRLSRAPVNTWSVRIY